MIVAYGAREKNHLELTTFDHTQYRKVGKNIETIALGEKLNIEQKVKMVHQPTVCRQRRPSTGLSKIMGSK